MMAYLYSVQHHGNHTAAATGHAEDRSRTFVEAYNQNRPDTIDDAVTVDFVCHHKASGTEIHGAEEFKIHITEMLEAFPDFSMGEEDFIVDGDVAAAHYRWTGTHEGEFQGIPTTGKQVDTTSMTWIRMEDEQVAELYIYGDSRGLVEQFGIQL